MLSLPSFNDRTVLVSFLSVALSAEALKVGPVEEVLADRPGHDVVHHFCRLDDSLPLALLAQGMLDLPGSGQLGPAGTVVRFIGPAPDVAVTLLPSALRIPRELHVLVLL